MKVALAKQMHEIDDTTIKDFGLPELSLMESAGHRAAQFTEKILAAFEENCCEENIFRAQLTKRLIIYVREKFGDELEFLWEKFPNAAVWRRQDTQKWYALIMEISERKLGLDSDNAVEILNLHGTPDDVKNLLDGEKYFPAYHMNKKSWFTIRLDGSISFDEICMRLDESHRLAVK